MTKRITLSFVVFLILFCANAYAGKGKIVFSNKPIDAATGETMAPTPINVGEKIYCRVYLAKKLSSYKPGTGYCINVKLGKEEFYEVNSKDFTKEEAADLTTFEFVLNQKEGESTFNKPNLASAFNGLKEGTHVVTVFFITAGCITESAHFSSEFTITKTTNSKVKIGTTFDNEVKAKMTNPDLEAKAVKALQDADRDKYRDGFMNKYKLDVIKLKIISEDWRINKKPSTGVITGRSIDMAVLVKENGQCLIKVYRFEQQYNGNGYQDSFGGYVGEALTNTNQYHPLKNKAVDCE